MHSEFPLFDIAVRSRDVALEAVGSNSQEWSDLAFVEFREMSKLGSHFRTFHQTFIAEDYRRYLTRQIGSPHHPNAWGGFATRLRKSGLIQETGRWIKMREKKSNARRSPEYSFV